MSQLALNTIGHFAFHDTGAPTTHGKNYTTLILIHGFAWHGGVYSRLIPYAKKYNSRLVLVNRRDYPGSSPLTDDERSLLDGPAQPDVDDSEALSKLLQYAQQRALETHSFLCAFVQASKLQEKSVIIAGWSFGSIWITQLLAYASVQSDERVPLYKYIKRLVWYDPPYHSLGYPPPATAYNPLTDTSLPVGEGIKLFPGWVSGYYVHGDSPSELEQRTPLSDPAPTILTMTPSDLENALYPAPGSPGGSDDVLLQTGIRRGLFKVLRERALYRSPPSDDVAESKRDGAGAWDDIDLRFIWCDQSVWELPWGTWALREELQRAEESGQGIRNVTLMRLKKANHFVHWDEPERALKALLSDSAEEDGN